MRIPNWLYKTVIGASVVCILAAVVFYFVFTVRPADGWSVTALSGTFENVDVLAFGPDDSLYATLKSKQNGQLIRILPGKTETLLAGLHNPDGLYYKRGYLYVTEEKKRDGRVISINLNNGETEVLATLNRPEGIWVGDDGAVLVVEDTTSARLIRIGKSGMIEVLDDQLNRAEGLRVDKQGNIYISETAKGRILKIHDGQKQVLIDDLSQPDQIEIGPNDALWITEDKFVGRLLRYKNGTLEVIARGLRAPQGMAFDSRGRLYLAEQRYNRILVFEKK